MAISADSLAQTHEQEFAKLRRASPFVRLWFFALCTVVIIAFALILRALAHFQGSEQTLRLARQELIASGSQWAIDFADMQDSYRDWLSRRGTKFESRTFDRVSEGLFRSAASFSMGYESTEQLGTFSRVYLALHSGAMRMSFVFLACWRLWIIAVIAALAWGGTKVRVYTKRDILGQTGNGRVFFSGARVSLDDPTPEGAPARQVTNLACPGTLGVAAAKTSYLGKLLEKYHATTTTNLALIGIILKYDKHAAYVAKHDQVVAFEQYFSTAFLPENTNVLLDKILAVHAQYAAEVANDITRIDSPLSVPSLGEASTGGRVTSGQYVDMLGAALHRVLTPSQRAAFGRLDAATVATITLAFEAGKVMAYGFEGGKWVQKSNFPQLAARSILHSVPEFDLEYDYDLRQTIRRALIFSGRATAFGPVKFPVDLSDESRAARQLCELLLASPHELDNAADEVELVGLVNEIHSGWERLFFEGTLSLDPEVIEEVYTTPSNLIFMPVGKVVRLMRRVAPRIQLERLDQLVTVISQKQKLRGVNVELEPDEADLPHAVPSYEKIFSPFTPAQLKEISGQHDISVDELRDWSALRVVLNAHGWLGRRVWERSVPESSVVYASFKVEQGTPGANDLGFIGRVGMVPLRGTRPEERWGRHWQSRYIQVLGARMAENRKDFEKLLRGEEDDIFKDEEPAAPAPSTGTPPAAQGGS